MTVTPKISVAEDNLVVHGKTILTGVPDNVILTPGSGVGLVQGAFIGVTSPECKSHHVFPIGVLDGLRFTCLFRFKLWWMTQRMGRCGKDVPLETQFMLVESKYGCPLSRENDLSEEEQTVYTVFLPLIEGQFRAVLQGNERDEIEVCLESGDASVKTNQGLYAVYIHAGSDPFEVITDAVRAVEKHLQTFQHREKKKLPAFVDWFGWCTWDAFYTDVTAEGVDEGLKSLSQGGTPPRFLIIDDGWQQIDSEVEDPKASVQEGAQFASRLTGIKENQKFRKHRKGTEITKDPPGLRHVVEEAKDHHNVNAKQTAVVRASDDFYPRDPASHTIHISSVAYNTMFLGEFMFPDWDMFHSLHPSAEYHGAARAVGGCAIYVSDKPGIHNFDLLKKLVLPDGSVLRAQLPGRPTRDCIFVDPARDGKSLLKIWNLNKYTGMVGAFNCQGAGWCKVVKKNRIHDTSPVALTGSIRSKDVDLLPQIAGDGWNGDSVFYGHRSGELIRIPKGAAIPITLSVLEYELYTVSPIKNITPQISFAAIGLTNMFNSGGAIDDLSMPGESKNGEHFVGSVEVKMKVRGCGRFGAYSTERPKQCWVDSVETDFIYDASTGLVTFEIPVPKEEMYRWDVRIEI